MLNFRIKKIVALKPASETKEHAKKPCVFRFVVIYKINDAARENRSYTTIRGNLKEKLKKELTDAGYKIEEYASDHGFYCTKISWDD